LIRDASGDFGCPSCWRSDMTRIRPADKKCPVCGVDLEWSEEAIEVSKSFVGRSRTDI
jgi:hypothetical protein